MHSIKSRLPPLIRLFRNTGQRFGVTIIPNHFYSEIPDYNKLKSDTRWREPWSMTGVQGTDLAPQATLLEKWCAQSQDDPNAPGAYDRACKRNGEPGYGPTEAQVLYRFIRAEQPGQIVQIGCGVSTALILDAVSTIEGYSPRIVCVEPFPTRMLRELSAAGDIELLSLPAQEAPLESLIDLEMGDLLFVDSTHTVRPGSEVLRVIYDVMPRLVPGVWVHFHDIYFPYDFSPGFLDHAFFGRESAFLHAYLCENPHYEINVSLSMLHHGCPDRLRTALPDYQPCQTERGVRKGAGHFPSSTYLKRCS